ncbi:MAG TPA: hypothetical protein PKE39_07610 [Ignavibacteria bacterium]|nr:hypothetical protein [Ignavibacteria bacterium]HMQ98877.1 hypothetical protein [Ignavibacteria bacterium]
MKPINGISIKRYAELCADMDGVIDDKHACTKIAAAQGITRSDWEAAHSAWQEKITDPSDMGRTASRFVAHWKEAMNKKK